MAESDLHAGGCEQSMLEVTAAKYCKGHPRLQGRGDTAIHWSGLYSGMSQGDKIGPLPNTNHHNLSKEGSRAT